MLHLSSHSYGLKKYWPNKFGRIEEEKEKSQVG
jgi:hypothetical protein